VTNGPTVLDPSASIVPDAPPEDFESSPPHPAAARARKVVSRASRRTRFQLLSGRAESHSPNAGRETGSRTGIDLVRML
jgi:hypothetical protein